MPIDLFKEKTFSLRQMARRLPHLRENRAVHPSTLWRWALRGLGGVRLETTMVGGTRVTTEEALRRFFESLAARAGLDHPPTKAGNGSDNEWVERELDAQGL
jgi:hypothetical protein